MGRHRRNVDSTRVQFAVVRTQGESEDMRSVGRTLGRSVTRSVGRVSDSKRTPVDVDVDRRRRRRALDDVDERSTNGDARGTTHETEIKTNVSRGISRVRALGRAIARTTTTTGVREKREAATRAIERAMDLDSMELSDGRDGVASKDMVVTKPKDIDDADFANYFCTYGYLYHQKDMLEDQSRMTAYHNAVRLNADSFRGKVVLDVGTGSGVLAMWAAQAGAKKVYAVEATHMAVQARKIVEANGLSDVVEVIQCKVEELELPEKVDVIISEWMGYFLLRESMFDSVLVARDKWMKPGGAMFPSHAKMYLSAIKTNKTEQKKQELDESLNVWDEFVANTSNNYGIDLSCMNGEFEDEQREHYLNCSAWCDIHPTQLLCAKPFTLASFDLNKCTKADIAMLRDVDFKLTLFERNSSASGEEVRAGAFAGWFDVTFAGSEANPCENVVELTTAPDANGATHWGQQAFYIHPEIRPSDGAVIAGKFDMLRRKENQRLYSVRMNWTQSTKEGKRNDSMGQRGIVWHIE